MSERRPAAPWTVWVLSALLLVFLGFASGALWESRAEAGVFTLRVSPDYAPPAEPGPPAGLLDINTASALELTDLPGIGPVLAQRIVDYREKHGPFAAPEELIGVLGIGEAKLAQVLPYIHITGGAG